MSNDYYNSPDDFDLDTHSDGAISLGIVESGTGQAQTLEHIQGTFFTRYLEIGGVNGSTEPNNSFTLESLKLRFQIIEVVNWIAFGPSARGERVDVAIGDVRNFQLAGVTYPAGMYVARPGHSSYVYPVPTARDLLLCVQVYPAVYAVGYRDVVTLLYGYKPDSRERLVGRG